jgi:hypothetical protein
MTFSREEYIGLESAACNHMVSILYSLFSMLSLLVVAAFCDEPAGSYRVIAVTSDQVVGQLPFLTRVTPLLFPDAKGEPVVDAAEIQVVSGYNLRLQLSIPRGISTTIVLWVRGTVTKITRVGPGRNTEVIPNGYQWALASATTAAGLSEISIALRDQKGFTGTIAEILATRTQVVSGQNLHIIFRDETDTLYSAVIYTPPTSTRKQVTFFEKVE